MGENVNIAEEVRECLAKVVGDRASGLAADDDRRESVDRFDSLTAAEFIAEVEDRFDVEVDYVMHDVRFRMGTLNRAAEFVGELLDDKAALS